MKQTRFDVPFLRTNIGMKFEVNRARVRRVSKTIQFIAQVDLQLGFEIYIMLVDLLGQSQISMDRHLRISIISPRRSETVQYTGQWLY